MDNLKIDEVLANQLILGHSEGPEDWEDGTFSRYNSQDQQVYHEAAYDALQTGKIFQTFLQKMEIEDDFLGLRQSPSSSGDNSPDSENSKGNIPLLSSCGSVKAMMDVLGLSEEEFKDKDMLCSPADTESKESVASSTKASSGDFPGVIPPASSGDVQHGLSSLRRTQASLIDRHLKPFRNMLNLNRSVFCFQLDSLRDRLTPHTLLGRRKAGVAQLEQLLKQKKEEKEKEAEMKEKTLGESQESEKEEEKKEGGLNLVESESKEEIETEIEVEKSSSKKSTVSLLLVRVLHSFTVPEQYNNKTLEKDLQSYLDAKNLAFYRHVQPQWIDDTSLMLMVAMGKEVCPEEAAASAETLLEKEEKELDDYLSKLDGFFQWKTLDQLQCEELEGVVMPLTGMKRDRESPSATENLNASGEMGALRSEEGEPAAKRRKMTTA